MYVCCPPLLVTNKVAWLQSVMKIHLKRIDFSSVRCIHIFAHVDIFEVFISFRAFYRSYLNYDCIASVL